MGLRETLEARLVGGHDDAMLRLSLAQLCLRASEWAAARDHAAACLAHDPDQAAASKTLGKALEALGDVPRAAAVYREGIERARAGGQNQTAREMEVFLRRLESRLAGS